MQSTHLSEVASSRTESTGTIVPVGAFGRQVDVELAAAFACQELHSVADTEHGQARRARGLEQPAIEDPLLFGNPVEIASGGSPLATLGIRAQIIAAG